MLSRTLPASLLLAAALSGCSGAAPGSPLPTAYEVHLSPTASVEDLTLAFQSLDDWAAATGVQFTRVLTTDGCHNTPCFTVAFQPVSDIDGDCGFDTALGCYYQRADGACAAIDDAAALDPGHKAQVARHEIGHALGLSHDSSQDAVMYHTLNGSPTITDRDVAQYWSLRGGQPACEELPANRQPVQYCREPQVAYACPRGAPPPVPSPGPGCAWSRTGDVSYWCCP